MLALGLGLTCSLSAQNAVESYKTTTPYGFNKPVMIDSTSNSGKKFSASAFLSAPSVPKDMPMLKEIFANDGFATLYNSSDDFTVQTLYFRIVCDKYEKKTIEILTNAMFSLSINSTKEKDKQTCEQEIDTTKSVKIEKTFEPGTYIVGIMLITDNKDAEFKIKTTVSQDEKESAAKKKSNFSQDKNGLTLKTMLCGENPYQVSVSDGGKFYMVKYYNTDTKGKSTYRIEVRSTKDDKIVFQDSKTTSYSWLTNSDSLYYRDKTDIYVVNPFSGERQLLCSNIPEGTINFLPDKEHFILSVTDKKDNTKEDLHRMYLPDDRIPGWRDRSSLYLYSTDGSFQPLTYSFRSTYLNDISPDGSKILFSVSKDSITARPFTFNSIYQLDIKTLRIDTLVFEDGFVSSAQYLKDGKNIVLIAGNEAFNSIGSTLKKGMIPNIFNNSIYLMNIATKQVNPVGKNFNPCVNKVIVRNNALYLTCQNKDSVSVYKYSLTGGTYSLINLNVDIAGSFDISADESFGAYYGENYNKPKRVFSARFSAQNADITEVCFPKKDNFEELTIGTMETFSFNMHNSQIDGRLYYPSDFDANKKYPMIVYYYGGCEPTDKSFEMRYSAWLYTQQGYVVYVINPSGTVGWGQEFAARHVNAWGDWTADEIIEGVKRVCKAKSFIDSKKIGCMGASYGGFMTQYLQTKTDIFAAAISHAGISNITSYWGEGYWGYSYSAAASAGSYPWNNPKLYTEHSPLFNADKIVTPLLLLHGTSDTNVPIGESIQMYNALKILGKEVEFITVKGENHGIVDFEKRLQWNNTIYAWFAKWLKGDASWWESMYPDEKL